MPISDVKNWLEIIAIVLAAIGGLWGGYRLAWAAARQHAGAIRAATSLHKHFGDDPGAFLRDLVVGLRGAVSAAEIEREILARHLGVGIYVCDPRGQCTYANDPLCDMFGLHRGEMRKTGWLRAVCEHDRERVRDQWINFVEKAIPYSAHYTLTDGRRVVTEAFPVTVDCQIVAYVGSVIEEKSDG